MREIYAKQSKDTTLPNSFARYMEAYKFFKSSPKFEETFLGSDEDFVGGEAPYSNKKKKQVPPSKVKKEDKPAGRDASKKALQSDSLVSKVSNEVHSQLQQFNQPDAAGMVSLDVFRDGLDRANETMSTIADMQVMAMAPDAIKQQYFTDLFASRMSAMANKKAEQELLKLETQNKQERLEIEAQELKLKKKRVMDRSDEELELMDDEEDMANMLSTAHNSNSPVGCLFPENKEMSSEVCNWPGCLFSELPPEKCQVENCGNYLHHMCQTEWMWKNKIQETQLKKECYYCCLLTYDME